MEYYCNKKQHRLKGFPIKKAADARASEIDSEVRKGMHTPTSPSGTIGDSSKDWVQRARDLKREKKTILQYENHIDLHIIPLTSTPVKEGDKPAWPGKARGSQARQIDPAHRIRGSAGVEAAA